MVGSGGWIDDVCKNPISLSVAKVEVLCGDGTQEVIGQVHGEIETQMNKAHGTPGTEYYVHTQQSVFLDILEQVRNLVLDWAIGLEKAGILERRAVNLTHTLPLRSSWSIRPDRRDSIYLQWLR